MRVPRATIRPLSRASAPGTRLEWGQVMRAPLRLLAAATLASTAASAAVSDPHPGVRLVNNGSTAMVVADLCAPGLSVRATKYSERNKTASGWAQSVDAEVAINADFFDFPGWSFVVGRARGAGEDWPADKQLKEVRSYWQFGVRQAGLVPNAATEPAFLITEIVGGHNILIENGAGKGPLYDGDAVLQGAHRRTAVGISADRRYLYLFVSNTPINGDGIVWNMVTHQGEAAAPPIAWATNMDGGGSSQLYVKGLGSVISSTRPVNNHLGIFAKGSGTSWHCNRAPEGWLDSVDTSGVVGWARDVDVPASAIDVHVYWGGPALSGAPASVLPANRHREDLCTAIGSCSHGFLGVVPLSLLDGQPHAVHGYGIDDAGLDNRELSGSPQTLQALAAVPDGVRRHVTDPDSYAAWQFDDFWQRLPLTDAQVEALPTGTPLPQTPTLVQADDGSPEVYVLDGDTLRHVPDPSVMAAWRFAFAQVEPRSAAELAALDKGPPWRASPVLVRRGDGAIYVIDTEVAPLGAPPSGGSGGGPPVSGQGGSSSTSRLHSQGDESSCSLHPRPGRGGGGAPWLALAAALWLRPRRPPRARRPALAELVAVIREHAARLRRTVARSKR